MSDLTGLELRKATWQVLHRDREIIIGDFGQVGYIFDGHGIAQFRCLGAIESDPAVAWPMFMGWCKKKGYAWQMGTNWGSSDVYLTLFREDTGHQLCDARGATPEEAICRAIVAAGNPEKTHES